MLDWRIDKARLVAQASIITSSNSNKNKMAAQWSEQVGQKVGHKLMQVDSNS